LGEKQAVILVDFVILEDTNGQKYYRAFFKSWVNKMKIYKDYMIDKYCYKYDGLVNFIEIMDSSEWKDYKKEKLEDDSKKVKNIKINI
jgi:hypothetical protein